MKLTLSDRINFIIKALKKHISLILIGLLFIGLGSIVIYVGIKDDHNIFLFCFGGCFIVFSLFFLGYTLPSSLLFYYEKALIEKFGSFTMGIVTAKHIEDYSYKERIDGRTNPIEEYHYSIDYKFTYQKEFINSFYIEHKSVFDKIEIGSKIPIKFLKTSPEHAEPRRQKLCLDLGFKRHMCS